MLFQKITNLILNLKDREFIMLEGKYIKVQLKEKMEILFMDLLEFNQENYQFLDLLVILKLSYLSIKEIQKY